MNKPSYEELESRFQNYCKHDGGRVYTGLSHTVCAICGWDTLKCQHRGEKGNYCSECGESLKKDVPLKKKLKIAYQLGLKAANADMANMKNKLIAPIAENPFLENSAEFDEWERGYSASGIDL